MQAILAIAVLLAALGRLAAQPLRHGMVTARSSSGQFLVFAPPVPSPVASGPVLAAHTNFISLTPALLVVSCERVKQSLYRTLGLSEPWRGEICIDLRAAKSSNDRIIVVSRKVGGDWQYRLELPDLLDRDRLARAVVQVLLMEIANRRAGARATEVPAWLAEGLSRELPDSSETELFLAPPTWTVRGVTLNPVTRNLVLNDPRSTGPLDHARQELRTHTALTFQQLSWPAEQPSDPQSEEVYSCSAHLFVDQLLRLKDGPACLRAMLARLPEFYNWQVAFLNAFRIHFHTLLDVEKWWALQLLRFSGRTGMQTWTLEQSCLRLEQIIRPPVDVRLSPRDLPLRTEASLQTMIREWDQTREIRVLRQKVDQLDLLRLQAAPQVVALVDDYRRVLQSYLALQLPSGTPLASTTRPRRPSARETDEVLQQLNALDARFQALRSPPPASAPDGLTPSAPIARAPQG